MFSSMALPPDAARSTHSPLGAERATFPFPSTFVGIRRSMERGSRGSRSAAVRGGRG